MENISYIYIYQFNNQHPEWDTIQTQTVMTVLKFNETTYEFRIHFGENTNSLHIIVDGELKKVREQVSTTPDTIEECVELLNYYDLY